MRRSLIPMSSIKKLVSIANRKKREEEKQRLIDSSISNEKELTPTYEIVDLKFDINSRNTKITFKQTKYYRTVERYVTQYYVKYPVYSDWKTKTKNISKSIKLTNAELESLNVNDDDLIREFADEIINKINIEELFPSWYIKKYIKFGYEEKIKELDSEQNDYVRNGENRQNENKKNITKYNNGIQELNEKNIKLNKKKIRAQHKIEKIGKAKKSIFLYIISMGIYYSLNSQKRLEKFKRQHDQLRTQIDENMAKISQLERNIEISTKNIETIKNNIIVTIKNIENKKECEKEKCANLISQVKPLQDQYIIDDSFQPLKLLSGFEYKKIIGCYVIHNKEKDKYYVGQSKDILRRLKQHFRGTMPNNIIFAEDYYSSKQENKDDLFEIKIIECSTKDELDRKEKNLIEFYDSWNKGYNGTSGNT